MNLATPAVLLTLTALLACGGGCGTGTSGHEETSSPTGGASSTPIGGAGATAESGAAGTDAVAGSSSGMATGGAGGTEGQGGATPEAGAGGADDGPSTLDKGHAVCKRACAAGCYVAPNDPGGCVISCDLIFVDGTQKCPSQTDAYVACLGSTEPIYFCPGYDMSSPCAAEALAMINCIKG